MTKEFDMNDIAQYFGKIKELLEENDKLKLAALAAESKVVDYRMAVKDLQSDIMNHKGALKRQADEIHVLYHKISNLLGSDLLPSGYKENPDARKRLLLHEVLDTLEPTVIAFKGTDKNYTLKEYGNKPWVNPVSAYPEPALMFC